MFSWRGVGILLLLYEFSIFHIKPVSHRRSSIDMSNLDTEEGACIYHYEDQISPGILYACCL